MATARRIPGIPVLLVITLAILAVAHEYPYDNVVTRWALTRQLVENGTIEIDPYQHLTNDKALSNGHYYCDKAVLTSLLAAVPHTVIYTLTGECGLPARYISERLIVGGALILLLFLIARSLNRSGDSVLIPLLALGAGSILLPYSTLLYGHIVAALFLYLCYHFQRPGRFALSDLFGALAAATEFPVLLPFLILVVYRGRKYWNPFRIARLAGLLVLAFIPQLIHNAAAFGSPFTMGYSLESTGAFEGMKEGLFGFTLPGLKSLYLLVLSPERGLFFYMPWAVCGLIGFFIGKSMKSVLRTNPLPVLILSYILLFSAYYMPTGGWAFGPRHLIPVIPFLALGLSRFAAGSGKRVFIAALLLLPSILMALIGTFGEIHLPVHPVENPVPFPQWSISLKMMLDGHHALWLFGKAGTAVAVLAVFFFWCSSFRKSRFTWVGIAGLLLWCAMLIPSRNGWGGKIDYYRGVLAEHRQEWSLAAEYFESAASDPTAPPVVAEKVRYCREREQTETGSDKEQVSTP